MASDGRDLLELLRAELRFIELGGYDLSNCKAWSPKAIFRDSLTCVNHSSSMHRHSCNECHLFDFVELEHRSTNNPCHFIRLSDAGETIKGLESSVSPTHLKHVVKNWLRWKIEQLELAEEYATVF